MKLKVVELTNTHGTRIKILNYGAKIMSIKTLDRDAELGEIVLGYDIPEEYLKGNPYFGATIGRCANRISNAKFSIGCKVYRLEQNQGKNHLHGGTGGFHQVYWKMSRLIKSDDFESITLSYTSADMEEGYPGELKIFLTYTLTNNNELMIDYLAESSKSTIVNLTHHSFFNLKDGGKSSIENHSIKIHADKYTPVSEKVIPTGEISLVTGTPFDFHHFHEIGERIKDDHQQLIYGSGYDHNYVLNKSDNELSLAAEVYEKESGRALEVYTTEPGLQFYTGNFLDGSDVGIEGIPYQKRSAFCLETQHFPDAPNHYNFPAIIIKPGEKYTQKTIYKFKVESSI
jgi:aldose 1-epimerase